MSIKIKRTLMALSLVAAAALGGSAIAGAANSGSTGSTGSTQQSRATDRDANVDQSKAHHPGEKLLTGTAAAKVEAAAKKELSGATIQRVENDADGGAAYEAHVLKSDGSEATVLVNKSFEVVKVVTGFGGGSHGHGGPDDSGATAAN
jgi:uncharacterized membrane protein YkoI